MLIRKVLGVVLFAGVVMLATGSISARLSASAPPGVLVAPSDGLLEGRVFSGEIGDESTPLQGVVVSAYGANNPYPDSGALIVTTTTDSAGWYGLSVPDGFEFYSIHQADLANYTSVGATTVSATVRTADWIEYVVPLAGKTLDGNKFWDRPSSPPTSTFRYVVDASLQPTYTLPGLGGRPDRRVAAVVAPDGSRDEFVVSELVLSTTNPAILNTFREVYSAALVLDSALPAPPPDFSGAVRGDYDQTGSYLLHVDLSRADMSNLAAWMEEMGFEGEYRFSSDEAVRLSAILAKERVQHHLDVVPDMPAFADTPNCVLCETEEILLWGSQYQDGFDFAWANDANLQLTRAWQYFDILNLNLSARPILAVIDGGFAPNADFQSAMAQYDFVDEDYDASGKAGGWHGTNVMSVAAARLNNRFGSAGTGGQAAAPMLLKISSTGSASKSTIAWAVKTAVYWGADVANISYGGECGFWCKTFSGLSGSGALNSATASAQQAGVIVLASAGNDEADLDDAYYTPCESPGTICVGAIDTTSKNATRNTTHGWGSNYGPNVNIWAPGDRIDTTPNPDTSQGQLAAFNGTSAATPYVAGIVTLMKAIKPNLSFNEAFAALQSTANPSTDTRVTSGYIDAYKAIKSVAANAGVQPQGDAYESNNTEATAYPLTGTSLSLNATIAPGDRDYFVFQTSDYMDVSVQVRYDDTVVSGNALTAELDGASGTQTGAILNFNVQLLPPGKHVIAVWGSTADSINCYQVAVSAAASTITPDEYDDQAPAGEPRNDSLANRAVISDIVQASLLLAMSTIDDLNLDVVSDIDFFEITLDSATGSNPNWPECKFPPPSDDPTFQQGYLEISTLPAFGQSSTAGYTWPFELKVYDAQGNEFTNYTSKSGVNLRIECPHQYFPDGHVRFSVRAKDGRRNFYAAWLHYAHSTSYITTNVPPWAWELTDPPLIRRLVPDVGWMDGYYPSNPDIIDQFLAGTAPDPLPLEYGVFAWEETRDLDLYLRTVAGHHMHVTLYNAGQQIIGETQVGGEPAMRGQAAAADDGHIHVPDLPPGTYVLAWGGDFTVYSISIGELQSSQVYLPLVMK